jgi:hypothetical protein
MKIKIVYLLFAVVLAGCAGSPLQTGVEAEQNRMQIGDVKMGMSQSMVRRIMGPAYKREIRMIDGHEYEVWYYLTKGTLLYQTRYLDRNFTPFIFSDNVLVGWGWKYFNHLFEMDEENCAPEESSDKIPESAAPKDKKLEETIRKILEEESHGNVNPQEAQPSTAKPSQKSTGEEMPEKASQTQMPQENLSPNKAETEPEQSSENLNPQNLEKPGEQSTVPQSEKMREQNAESNEVPKAEENKELQKPIMPEYQENAKPEEKANESLPQEAPSCKKNRSEHYNWWE